MPFRTLSCPSCGAPLPPNAKRTTVTCAFCKATVAWEEPVVHAADYRAALAALDGAGVRSDCVTVAGMPYRILRRIAVGESTDVLLAERARAITERVVLKVTRAAEDADLLDNAWSVLHALHASTAQGTEHFAKLVPTPIARGIAQGLDLSGREVFVQRFMSGFVHTLADVRRAYPQGVEPRHAVWLWRRMLETLDWVHRAGFVHGALLPQHVLVHARDHGVMLIGFSCAQRGGMPARALHPAHAAFYPKHRGRIRLSTALDLGMVARNVLYVLGSDDGHTVPASLPAPLAALLHATLDTSSTTIGAMDLAECIAAAAKTAFGPPKFVELRMPGWQ